MISALTELSGYALLVLACDLPFGYSNSGNAFANRESTCLATAYRSSHDGLPEPLCAIRAALHLECKPKPARWHSMCPERSSSKAILTYFLPSPEALDNINTPDEYEEAVLGFKFLNEDTTPPILRDIKRATRPYQ